MPCSYSVTSEDTADFISTYSALPEQLSAMTGIECIDFVSRQFAVLHIPMDDLESPMNFSYYTYSAIPCSGRKTGAPGSWGSGTRLWKPAPRIL